jgi:hypothetical protein
MIDSEIIAKYLIGKIISYTITKSRRNEFQKNIPQFTYDYMKILLHDTLNMDIITYDQDIHLKDTDLAVIEETRLIFHENRIYGENDYSYLREPVSSF